MCCFCTSWIVWVILCFSSSFPCRCLKIWVFIFVSNYFCWCDCLGVVTEILLMIVLMIDILFLSLYLWLVIGEGIVDLFMIEIVVEGGCLTVVLGIVGGEGIGFGLCVIAGCEIGLLLIIVYCLVYCFEGVG